MSGCHAVVVPLADGFEEIEAVTIIDVLRRADIPVVVAGVSSGSSVRGAHGLELGVDMALAAVSVADIAMVALPGGMPGSVNLAESDEVQGLLRRVWDAGRHVAAICAAPLALQAAGILKGRRTTGHPSVRAQLTDGVYTGARVERDGRLITGTGPGTALEFALALVSALGKPDVAAQLHEAMLVR